MKKLSISPIQVNFEGSTIWVGEGAHKKIEFLLKKQNPTQVVIIADSRLKSSANLLASRITQSGWKSTTLSLRVSESLKNFHSIYPIYGQLLEMGADRGSILIAFGGGVIGDITGFIAGTYQRGIPWIGIPTTLLSQVDSCIGGKTGVNHAAGKNLIGVFHPPSSVICDVSYLETLSKWDRISGFGEIVKMALILDPNLYEDLNREWKATLNSSFCSNRWTSQWTSWISKSLKLKAKIIEKDFTDRSGIRNILNFGHTLGHVLEAETNYRFFRHGEAVIHGMRGAILISNQKGYLSDFDYKKIDSFLAELPIRKIPKNLSIKNCLERVQWDKKARDKKPLFILLRGIAKTIQDTNVQEAHITNAFEKMMSRG